ncbi:MAG: class I SAM-dependent methyltransferase [Geminicoccaceae bacterium]
MDSVESLVRSKAAVTYDAAADHFDEAPLAFWNRHGQLAVERLGLRSGDRVLDVGCGTGASALPAAVAVGPTGTVTGIDVAANMLKRARGKAQALSLENVDFVIADMSATGFPDESFDSVISIFSVFFVADMEAQIAELWHMLRPNGRLAITVWSKNAFQPAASIFGEELCRLRPDLAMPTRPWERLSNPDALRRLMLDGGTTPPNIVVIDDRQTLIHSDDWWTIAMGSGYRWEIEQLAPAEQSELRRRTSRRLSDMGADAIETAAIHAVAIKAG